MILNTKITKLLAAIAGISLIAGILAGVICICSTGLSFYTKEYAKLGVAEDIGISSDDLGNATEILIDYTTGDREDMVAMADFGGEIKEVFNDREKAHMVDVQKLFLGAKNLSWICVGAAAGLFILLFIFAKQKRDIFRGYTYSNYIFLAVFALIAVYAAVDFTSFWTSFHHVFFTNDLWLLDPATDNLILMVPEQFFFDLVFRIVAWFVGIGGVLYLVSLYFGKKPLKGAKNVS